MSIATLTEDLTDAVSREQLIFDVRRRLLGHAAPTDRTQPTVGLALSGGGIRSATFSLGLLQALSRHGLVPSIDYISSVSGGSYIGAFFGAFFVNAQDMPDDRRLTYPLQSALGKKAVANLREFGRYLTPGGTSDMLLGVAIVSRNWVAVQFVLGLVPLLLFLLISAAMAAFDSTGIAASFTLIGAGVELWLIPGAMAYATLAFGNAYWFTRREQPDGSRWKRMTTNGFFILGVAIVAAAAAVSLMPDAQLPDWAKGTFSDGLTLAALLIGPAVAVFLLFQWIYGKAGIDGSGLQAEDKVRSHLSRWLATCMLLTGAAIALAAIAWLGAALAQTLAEAFFVDRAPSDSNRDHWAIAWDMIRRYWPMAIPVAPIALTIWGHGALRRRGRGGLLQLPTGQTMLGLSVLLFWLILWSAVAFGLSSRWDADVKALVPDLPRALKVAAMVAIVIAAIALSYTFLNLSSLSTLYASRLRRAYIGASNPSDIKPAYDVDRPGDLLTTHAYYPPEDSHGGPMHLINITIAQTVAEASNVVAHDRKGKAMHIGPAGIVHEGATPGSTRLRAYGDCEQLPISTWTAISGAAASTAVGAQTSVGLSLLAMMTNVRLGYWWKMSNGKSGMPQGENWGARLADTVYGYLGGELQGRFKADDRRHRWYLTDGGHYDNSGAYPLLQRKLPFIIIADNGADPRYAMADILRLMLRARSDLGVEIECLNETEVAAALGVDNPLTGWIGTFAALSAAASRNVSDGPYAALARIHYSKTSIGTMLIIKPRLCLAEPPELLGYYKSSRRVFPQQTTADQFFDEEQWEAYRRLGEVIGDRLFGAVSGVGQWSPSDMRALP